MDKCFANFVHEFKYEIANSYEFFARKIDYVTNGLYCKCFLYLLSRYSVVYVNNLDKDRKSLTAFCQVFQSRFQRPTCILGKIVTVCNDIS